MSLGIAGRGVALITAVMALTISVREARASACDVCCGASFDDVTLEPVVVAPPDPASLPAVEAISDERLIDPVAYSWDHDIFALR